MPKGRAVIEDTSRPALAGFSQKELDPLQARLLRINANLDCAASEDDKYSAATSHLLRQSCGQLQPSVR